MCGWYNYVYILTQSGRVGALYCLLNNIPHTQCAVSCSSSSNRRTEIAQWV